MSGMPGFDAAQRAYDNATPPDDGPAECDNCRGFGHAPAAGDPEGDHDKCPECKGFGLIDDNGEPFDPNQTEHDACEFADMKRDEEACNG